MLRVSLLNQLLLLSFFCVKIFVFTRYCVYCTTHMNHDAAAIKKIKIKLMLTNPIQYVKFCIHRRH